MDDTTNDDPSATATGAGVEGAETLLSYADAMDELESILAELERDDVDIDHLTERVARAAALIELCRGRIESARLDVTRLVENLD
jgi:exodeoxyribonuclease VII small subunit